MNTIEQVTDTQITDMADDLTGFHPLLDAAVSALTALAHADLTADKAQTLVAALGGCEDANLATFVALILRRTASPDTNPALVALPKTRKQTLRRLGAEYAAAISDHDAQDIASEMSAAIDGL